MPILGVDVGGTNIKAGLVDVETGQLVSPRRVVDTPDDPQPESVIQVISDIVKQFDYRGLLGIGVPTVSLGGRSRTPFAAYQVKEWVGYPVAQRVSDVTGCRAVLMNDADAAGIAEMSFGAGRGQMGVVIVLTIGTGIGSAVFNDGVLVPNTEFGHLYLRGQDDVMENYVSERARVAADLSPDRWAERLNVLLDHLHRIFWPTLFILGGGVTEHVDVRPLLDGRYPVEIARLGNSAGITGTALGAYRYGVA